MNSCPSSGPGPALSTVAALTFLLCGSDAGAGAAPDIVDFRTQGDAGLRLIILDPEGAAGGYEIQFSPDLTPGSWTRWDATFLDLGDDRRQADVGGLGGQQGYLRAVLPVAEPTVELLLVGSLGDLGSVRDVAVSGNHAYLADSSSGLRVVDVLDPANPREVGYFDPPGSTAGQGVYYADSYLYLADGLGLEILDVSDPTQPLKTGFHHPPGFTVKVQVVGPYAFAANREGGLGIADISDPYNPQPISTHFDVGSVRVTDLWVSGAYAYVAMEAMGLRVVDVSDPANPQEVGFFDTPGTAQAVVVAGAYVYLADGAGGLRIIDVSDPTRPHEVGFYPTQGEARSVEVADAHVFVGHGESILVLDVADPRSPRLAGEYETLGVVWGIQVVDGLVCVANGNRGFLVLRVQSK